MAADRGAVVATNKPTRRRAMPVLRVAPWAAERKAAMAKARAVRAMPVRVARRAPSLPVQGLPVVAHRAPAADFLADAWVGAVAVMLRPQVLHKLRG